jgi:arabinose-5-phosphate isomerase
VRLLDAILEVTRKRMGMTAIVGPDGQLAGYSPTGHLRRLLERGGDVHGVAVDSVMTRHPLTIGSAALAAAAVKQMEERRVSQLLVVDDGRLVGALNIHDLLAAKVA